MTEFHKFTSQIADKIDSVAYIADIDNYELLYMNATCLALYGNPPIKQWYKKKCYEFLQGKKRPCEFCSNQFLIGTKPYHWDYFNPILKRYFRIKDQVIYLDGKKLRLELASDFTDSIATIKQSNAINACIGTLHTNESPSTSIEKLLKIIADFYGSNRASILLLNKDKNKLSCTYEWHDPLVLSHKPYMNNIDFDQSSSWVQNIISKDATFYTIDTDNMHIPEIWHDMFRNFKIKSFLLAPLNDKNGDLSGFIGIENPYTNIERTNLISSVNMFVSDFINKNELIEKLNYLSYVDTLTGIKNRNSYRDTLERFESQPPDMLGIIHIDINGLKEINEARGHLVGDGIIIAVAKEIKELFPDDAYRLGGDEFIVFKEDVEREEFEREANILRERLAHSEDFKISIGVIWNNTCTDISTSLEYSDELMYLDKQSYYNAGIKNPKYHKMLLNTLLNDIKQNRFYVYLQPQIDLSTNKISSAEALVRKIDDFGNVEPPLSFIPLYEKEEIIPYLDYYVFETVCKIFESWQKRNIGDGIKVAVNMSRCSLQQENLAERFDLLCKKYDVQASRFIIEITESTQALDNEFLYSIIRSLSAKGFNLSLDDFGSGYSNLSILADFAFDEVKIDKSLIDGLTESARTRVLTRSALEICNSLQINTLVAEGIETQEQYEIIKEYKCTKGQGYFFARPMPVEEFESTFLLK